MSAHALFAAVYSHHGDAVRALARRQLGDPAEADDVAAATFSLLMTIPGPHTLAAEGAEVRAFVLGVCLNLIRRARRARARRREVLARYGAETAASVDDVEQTVERRELAAQIDRALAALPDEQREAMHLCVVEERSAAEVARLHGVAEATVRTRLFHARRKLRAVLERPRLGRWRSAIGVVLLLGFATVALARPRVVVAAYRTVLRVLGLDAGPRRSDTTPHLPPSKPTPHSPPPNDPTPYAALPGATPPHSPLPGDPTPHAALPGDTPPYAALPGDTPPHSPLRSDDAPPGHALAPPPDPLHALYLRAHRAQFVTHDYAAALRDWDRYLAPGATGPFAWEARYNRAIALAELGRFAAARRALAPFAAGVYGDYRRDRARELLATLPNNDNVNNRNDHDKSRK